jgi:hypothetical protein
MIAKTAPRFPFVLCLWLSREKIARISIFFSALVALLRCGSVQAIWSQTPSTAALAITSNGVRSLRGYSSGAGWWE